MVYASGSGSGPPTIGFVHIVALPEEECEDKCKMLISQCDDSPLPDCVSAGEQLCLRAAPDPSNPTECDCDGEYDWKLLASVPQNAFIVGEHNNQQVTVAFIEPAEVHVSVTKGGCAGGHEFKVISVALCIDGENDHGYDIPPCAGGDDPVLPGKLIPINTGNLDEDAVPDFADGYDLDGVAGNDDDHCADCRFVPMILRIESGATLNDTSVVIDYSASDPAAVNVDGSFYEPAAGNMRIWRSDGDAPRNMNSVSDPENPGDYVPPGTHTVESLGLVDHQVTLYVEGISIAEGQSLPIEIYLEGDGSSTCGDLVYVRLFELELVAFDDETGEEYPAESVIGPSNLDPDLRIWIMGSRLTANGTIEVDIEGHVKDRLSELADNPAQRLQQVRFYVNGEYHSAIVDLPAMSPGQGVMPWQPYLLDVNFSTTLVIDSGLGHARPGGYVIDALTSPNAAGRTAMDTIFVTVQWHMLEDLFNASLPGGGAQGLTMQFMIPPSDVISDWAWV